MSRRDETRAGWMAARDVRDTRGTVSAGRPVVCSRQRIQTADTFRLRQP